jgi:hypothetical protein
MPIEYRIDLARRLVVARATGVVTDDDVFGYQREVWSRPEVAGFDELIDMSATERIVSPPPGRVHDLAALAVAMDTSRTPSRFAIVAPQDVAYGLGRMFEINRELMSASKQVGVFRTLAEGLAFLGLEPTTDLWGSP